MDISREIVSVEKTFLEEIMNDHEDESNKDIVQLIAQNAELAFQGYAYAENLKVNLIHVLNMQLEQIEKVERSNTRCKVK